MKASYVAAVAVVSFGLILAGGCGSGSPAVSKGNQAVQTPRPDYRYAGKLDSDQQAMAGVLAFLSSEATSDSGRLYLAEYLMVAKDRVATMSEDNTSWYVTFSMDRKADSEQGEKSYWEAAAWMVFKSDGTILPSTRHSGNANRILADLRAAGS